MGAWVVIFVGDFLNFRAAVSLMMSDGEDGLEPRGSNPPSRNPHVAWVGAGFPFWLFAGRGV